MKTVSAGHLGRAAVVLVMAMGARDLFGQPVAAHRNEQATTRGTERLEKIRQVLGDKAGYAAAIVTRWEGAAREAGRARPATVKPAAGCA